MRRDIALGLLFVGTVLMIASIPVNTPDGYVVLCGVGGIAWSIGAWWLLKQKIAYWKSTRNA